MLLKKSDEVRVIMSIGNQSAPTTLILPSVIKTLTEGWKQPTDKEYQLEEQKLKDALTHKGYTKYNMNKVTAENSKEKKPDKQYNTTAFLSYINGSTNFH